MWRLASATVVLAAAVAGQGTKPRADASAYEVQGAAGDLKIGADYLVHSIPASSGYLNADDYLIVEAAVFGPRAATIKLSLSDFVLRITGVPKAGTPKMIEAQSPSFAPSFTGRPRTSSPIPTSINNSGVEKEPAVPFEKQVEQASLPAGEHKVPISGALFFPFKGKTVSIKSLELMYTGPAGKVTLKFF